MQTSARPLALCWFAAIAGCGSFDVSDFSSGATRRACPAPPGGTYTFTLSFVEARFPAGGGCPTTPAFDGDTLVVRFNGNGPSSVTDGTTEWYCTYTAPIDTDFVACVLAAGGPADELDVKLISDCDGGVDVTAEAFVGGTVGGDAGYPACIEHYAGE